MLVIDEVMGEISLEESLRRRMYKKFNLEAPFVDSFKD